MTRRTNWALAEFPGEQSARDSTGALDVARLRWLCGCGRSKCFVRAKAFPICRCGRRMRMLDHPGLAYARHEVRDLA